MVWQTRCPKSWMAKSKHVRSTFECHWDAHPGGCVRTNHGYCPSPISERDTHHSGNMGPWLMGVCLKLSSPDSTKPSSIVLYHWIGLLGKILTGNPWVFTIKYRAFRSNFSHNPILWLYQWKFSSLQNLRTNPKPLSSCFPGAHGEVFWQQQNYSKKVYPASWSQNYSSQQSCMVPHPDAKWPANFVGRFVPYVCSLRL